MSNDLKMLKVLKMFLKLRERVFFTPEYSTRPTFRKPKFSAGNMFSGPLNFGGKDFGEGEDTCMYMRMCMYRCVYKLRSCQTLRLLMTSAGEV